jgi:hypothetical protein
MKKMLSATLFILSATALTFAQAPGNSVACTGTFGAIPRMGGQIKYNYNGSSSYDNTI